MLKRNPPISEKALIKKLDDLKEFGLKDEYFVRNGDSIKGSLYEALSPKEIDQSQSIYVLDWWRAYLVLNKLFDHGFKELEVEDPKLFQKYIEIMRNYSINYFVSAYDMSFDREFDLNIWGSFQHFLQLAIVNPNFRITWPLLHRATLSNDDQWLGVLINNSIKLEENTYLHGSYYEKDDLVIKLLRGRFITDQCEFSYSHIAKSNILSLSKTNKPSDMLEFLTDIENNSEHSRYFIPKVHNPFIIYEDGCGWSIIDRSDKESEASAMRDCASSEHGGSIIISLRQPVSGTYFYQTLLRAEINFSNEEDPVSFETFKDRVGVVNQLRGFANSKPSRSLHKYIIKLLEQPWIQQLVRPSHRPNDIFWITDLDEPSIDYLRFKNPILFDSVAFYEKFKNLEFNSSIRTRIISGIEFSRQFVTNMVSESDKIEDDNAIILRLALSKEGKFQKKDNEYTSELLEAVENSLPKIDVVTIDQSSMILSTKKIVEILNYANTNTNKKNTYLLKAISSLEDRIKNKDSKLEEAVGLARKLLYNSILKPSMFYQDISESLQRSIIHAGVGLDTSQFIEFIKNNSFQNYSSISLMKRLYKLFNNSDRQIVREDVISKLIEPGSSVELVKEFLDILILDPGMIIKILSEPNIQAKNNRNKALLAINSAKNLKYLPTPKALKIKRKILKLVRDYAFSIQTSSNNEEVLKIISLSDNDLVKLLTRKGMSAASRSIGLEFISKKLRQNSAFLPKSFFLQIRKFFLKSTNIILMMKFLKVFNGFAFKDDLISIILNKRIDLIFKNKDFEKSIIESAFPGSKTEGFGAKSLTDACFKTLKTLVKNHSDESVKLYANILWTNNFDEASKDKVLRLLIILLYILVKNNKYILGDLCDVIKTHLRYEIKTNSRLNNLIIKLVKINSECSVSIAFSLLRAIESKEDRSRIARKIIIYSLKNPNLKSTLILAAGLI